MKRIVAGGLLGWAGIVALGWWLAQQRIELCPGWPDYADKACVIRATAARDAVLTGGLTVALVGLLLVVAVKAILRRPRANMAQSAGEAMMRRKGPQAGRWLATLPKMWRTAGQGVSGGAYRRGSIIAALAFIAGTLSGFAGLSYANSVAQQRSAARPWELDAIVDAGTADCAAADVQSGDAAPAQ